MIAIRYHLAAALGMWPVVGSAQQGKAAPSSQRIAAVERGVAEGDKSAAAGFWAALERTGDPFIETIPGNDEQVLATFVWKDPGDTKSVVLDARINSMDPARDPRARMRRVQGSDIWYLSHVFPADGEVLYQFVVNAPDSTVDRPVLWQRYARPDPLNGLPYPERSDPLYDVAQPWRNGSIARMPAVADNRWLAKRAVVAAGAITRHAISSATLTLANPRTVWVYTTPGPVPKNANLLVLLDGNSTYQHRIPTTTMLDNLYADHRIGPTVAVFVDNGGTARALDMNFSDAFVRFLSDELVPWVEREYAFTASADRTVLGGDSLCGLIGAYAALQRPDIFGQVLAQSGAFQFSNSHDTTDHEPEWIVRSIVRRPARHVSFYLEVGRVEDRPEGNEGTSLLAANRHLRDVLIAKGYAVRYTEVYGDHDPVHWRRTLPEALIATLRR